MADLKPGKCCNKALKDLNHTWIIYEGNSYYTCSDCCKNVIEKALGENKDVEYSHERTTYYIDTVGCTNCGRSYKAGRTVNPCSKCS